MRTIYRQVAARPKVADTPRGNARSGFERGFLKATTSHAQFTHDADESHRSHRSGPRSERDAAHEGQSGSDGDHGDDARILHRVSERSPQRVGGASTVAMREARLASITNSRPMPLAGQAASRGVPRDCGPPRPRISDLLVGLTVVSPEDRLAVVRSCEPGDVVSRTPRTRDHGAAGEPVGVDFDVAEVTLPRSPPRRRWLPADLGSEVVAARRQLPDVIDRTVRPRTDITRQAGALAVPASSWRCRMSASSSRWAAESGGARSTTWRT